MALTKEEEQKILLKWYERRSTYEEFGKELRHRIDSDPIFPRDATHLISHRLKNAHRLTEKIRHANGQLEDGLEPITADNFEERIEDLLGMKIICLRPSDIPKVDTYLRELGQADQIQFVRVPVTRKPFTLPTDGGEPQGDVELTYTGYASVHYIIRLGGKGVIRPELQSLKGEIQLRTILDEAWGEIDHKYRYERTRTGKTVPIHIDRLFRTAAWYIRLVAQHLEYACDESDKVFVSQPVEQPKSPPEQPGDVGATSDAETAQLGGDNQELQACIDALLKMSPSQRTWNYIQRRFSEHEFISNETLSLKDLTNAGTVGKFIGIYKKARDRYPFVSETDQERDLVLFVNFGIFTRVHSPEVAEEGLRTRLHNLNP